MKTQLHSLRWRLFLQYMVIVALLLSTIGSLIYFQVQNRFIENRFNRIRKAMF